MSYCQPDEKATVNYTLGDDSREYNFVSEQGQIDVVVTQLSNNTIGGRCPDRYTVTFLYECAFPSNTSQTLPQVFQKMVWEPILSVGTSPQFVHRDETYAALQIQINCCGETTAYNPIDPKEQGLKNITIQVYQYANLPAILNFRYTIQRYDQPLDTCGDNSPKCKIEVSRKGSVIHSNVGNCPIDFNVQCGEQCPPGTCECVCEGNLVCCYNDLGIVVKSFYR